MCSGSWEERNGCLPPTFQAHKGSRGRSWGPPRPAHSPHSEREQGCGHLDHGPEPWTRAGEAATQAVWSTGTRISALLYSPPPVQLRLQLQLVTSSRARHHPPAHNNTPTTAQMNECGTLAPLRLSSHLSQRVSPRQNPSHPSLLRTFHSLSSILPSTSRAWWAVPLPVPTPGSQHRVRSPASRRSCLGYNSGSSSYSFIRNIAEHLLWAVHCSGTYQCANEMDSWPHSLLCGSGILTGGTLS